MQGAKELTHMSPRRIGFPIEVFAVAPSFNSVVVPIAEVPREDIAGETPARPFVLVVDDEPMVADTLAAILLRAGFDTVPTYSARAALELTRGVQPAFLISDVHMPGMNGIELAMVMAEQFPTCKVLLFSGHATVADLADARAAGYDFPLLAKPVHPAEIVRHLSKQLKVAELAGRRARFEGAGTTREMCESA
jgi:DNA-binding NtrC family response regulator